MTDSDRRFKVTVWYSNKPKETYRNQTSKEASAWERFYVKNPDLVTAVRVENETNLKGLNNG